jgi:hypothetical protein
MNGHKILTVFFLLFFYHANSQRNLQPSYIVLNNSDTLKGFIDYKEWYKNPTSILFKSSLHQSLTEYKKSEISAFEVIEKEAYRRFKVSISLDPNAFDKLAEKDTSSVTDSVLLKVVFLGNKASLYSYNDNIKMRYYLLLAAENTPVELRNSSYLLNGQVASRKEYRAQLLALARQVLPGNGTINDIINNADYSKKELLGVFYQLNGLSKEDVKIKTKRSPFQAFIGIGVNRGALEFTGQSKYSDGKATIAYSPLIMVGADLFFNREVGRLFLRNSLGYSSFKSEASAVAKYFEGTENYTFKLKQTNVAFQSQISYNIYNQTSFKWFVGVGAAANFSSYPTNNQVLVREGLSSTTISNTDNFLITRKFWLCTAARTGVTIQKIDLAIAYYAKSNVISATAYGINNSSLQLQALYLFGKR